LGHISWYIIIVILLEAIFAVKFKCCTLVTLSAFSFRWSNVDTFLSVEHKDSPLGLLALLGIS